MPILPDGEPWTLLVGARARGSFKGVNWLRRHQDVVSLVAAWGLLLQVLIGPLLPSLHAMSGDGAVMCTAKGLVAAKPATPTPARHGAACDCCSFACRVSCGSTSAGLLPQDFRVPLPPSALILINGPRHDAPRPKSPVILSAQARGPPIS